MVCPDSTSRKERYLKFITSDFNLRHVCSFPTHICQSEGLESLLDLVFVNIPEVVPSARVLSPLSDHLPILLYTHLQTPCFYRIQTANTTSDDNNHYVQEIARWYVRRADLESVENSISEADWESVFAGKKFVFNKIWNDWKSIR